MTNTFPDKCEECKENMGEYKVLMEDDDPYKTITKTLCAECLAKSHAVIEALTFQEWLES